jgi:hypothetical protein
MRTTESLNRLTHLPVRGASEGGFAFAHNETYSNSAPYYTTSIYLPYPAAWPTGALVRTYLQFETHHNQYRVDDYFTLNAVDPAFGYYGLTVPVYDVTGQWQPSTSTFKAYNCPGPDCVPSNTNDNNYVAAFHPVHVLQVPTVTFTNPCVCAGFDDITEGPFAPWVSVPVNGSNTLIALVSPASISNQVSFVSANTNIVTVTPTTPASASETLTLHGHSAGTADITATIGGATVAKIHVDVLPLKTNVTVALYYVTATGDSSTTPTNVPTAAQLQEKLNAVYGQQANVFFAVSNQVATNVAYDGNTNGMLDLLRQPCPFDAGEVTVVNTNLPAATNFRVFYVKALTNACGEQAAGWTPKLYEYIFSYTLIQDTHNGSPAYIAAHEMGHMLGGLKDLSTNQVPDTVPGQPDRLMWYGAGTNEPCRLIRKEWKDVSDKAQQLP